MPVIPVILSIIAALLCAVAFFVWTLNSRMRRVAQSMAHQYALLVKMQTVLKSKSATNAVAENAEMIYQDLLQSLIPIMAAIDVMPRATSEHPLWRALGGILDEYGKNPFALEKLRRAIKLDANVSRNVANFSSRADAFLAHLNASEPDGILAATFTNGLLGQSLMLFEQARQLANAE